MELFIKSAAKVQQKMHIRKNFTQKFTFKCKINANALYIHVKSCSSAKVNPLKINMFHIFLRRFIRFVK